MLKKQNIYDMTKQIVEVCFTEYNVNFIQLVKVCALFFLFPVVQ